MTQQSNVAVIEPKQEQPARLPTIMAGGAVRPIVPQDFDSAWRIAKAVCTAGMAPRGIDTPEKAMVAIMHGLEVGLTPMNALQSIAVVNGRPTIWGDGAIGLARGSGLLEWMKETFEGQPFQDGFKAVCLVKRKGEPEPTRGEFSVADAKLSGLWGKKGRSGEPTPWITYPKRMLQMRARAFALRDGFADVLKGLGIKEEVEDYTHNIKDITPREQPPAPPPVDEAPPPPPTIAPQEVPLVQGEIVEADPETGEVLPPDEPPKDPAPQKEKAKGKAKPAENEPTAAPDAGKDPEAFRAWVEKTLAAVTDPAQLETVWNDQIAPRVDGLFPPDQEDCLAIYKAHEKRLGID